MTATDTLAQAHAADLERLHAKTGDRRFLRAARALRGSRPGRKAKDDADTLAEAEALVADGEARSFRDAALKVASRLEGVQSVDAVVKRLEVKFRAKRAADGI